MPTSPYYSWSETKDSLEVVVSMAGISRTYLDVLSTGCHSQQLCANKNKGDKIVHTRALRSVSFRRPRERPASWRWRPLQSMQQKLTRGEGVGTCNSRESSLTGHPNYTRLVIDFHAAWLFHCLLPNRVIGTSSHLRDRKRARRLPRIINMRLVSVPL